MRREKEREAEYTHYRVVLGQLADKLEQSLHLLERAAPALLKQLKEAVELLRLKVPSQLGQQVVDVVDNRLVLAQLALPHG